MLVQHFLLVVKYVCSISEERLTRRKHDGNYPINSIEYCLSAGNITAEDVDLVCPVNGVNIFYKKLYGGVIDKVIKETFLNAEFNRYHTNLFMLRASVSSDFNEGSFPTLDGAGSVVFGHDLQRTFLVEQIPSDTSTKRKVSSVSSMVFLVLMTLVDTIIFSSHLIVKRLDDRLMDMMRSIVRPGMERLWVCLPVVT